MSQPENNNNEDGQQPPQDDPMGAFDRTVIVQLDHFFEGGDENNPGGGTNQQSEEASNDGDGRSNEERRDSPFARPLIPVQILLSSFMAALRARNGGNGSGLGPQADFAGMGFRIDRSPHPSEYPLHQQLSHLRQHAHEHSTEHANTDQDAQPPNAPNPANGNGEMGERSSLLERIEELHSRNPYGEQGHFPPPFTITINFPIAGGLHHEKKPDPARAERILVALPKLHKGVTRRMSRVGVETTCGVCLDSLNAKAQLQKSENASEEGETSSSSTPNLSPEEEAKREDEIVALPCSHVFHSNCLRPWFALHTLCPMCRFDLDPESMTMSTPPPEERGSEVDDNPFVSIIERLVRGNRERGPRPGPEESNNGGRAESTATSNRNSRHHPYARTRSATEGSSSRNTRSSTTPTLDNLTPVDETPRPAPPPKKFEIPKAGRSLEDILIKRERENGLRCDIKECKLGPTDESESLETATMLSIGGAEKPVCSHFLHSHCYHLANGNGRYYNPMHTHQDGCVDSKCPICKAAGRVQKHELVQ